MLKACYNVFVNGLYNGDAGKLPIKVKKVKNQL